MGGSKRTVLFLFKSSTYATIPPSYLKSWLLSERSSRITTRSPGLRNASSRIRLESTSKLKSVASRTVASGLKVTFVPRSDVVPMDFTGPSGMPVW